MKLTNRSGFAAALWLFVSGFVFHPTGLAQPSITVRFDTADRAPSEILTIGGVTVSGDQPATVEGQGLGATAVGGPGSVDRIMQTLDGAFVSDQFESLNLEVDGVFSSITFLPYFEISTPWESVKLPFEISYFAFLIHLASHIRYILITPSDLTETVLDFAHDPHYTGEVYSLGYFSATSDFGQWHHFNAWLTENGFPDVTFQMGFTIEAIEYIPDNLLTIDIKPGDASNIINPDANGKISVAILSTASFSSSLIDPESVLFGATGSEATPCKASVTDSNGDGLPDLLLQFRTNETDISWGDTAALLTAATWDGTHYIGQDAIGTPHRKGLQKHTQARS